MYNHIIEYEYCIKIGKGLFGKRKEQGRRGLDGGGQGGTNPVKLQDTFTQCHEIHRVFTANTHQQCSNYSNHFYYFSTLQVSNKISFRYHLWGILTVGFMWTYMVSLESTYCGMESAQVPCVWQIVISSSWFFWVRDEQEQGHCRPGKCREFFFHCYQYV